MDRLLELDSFPKEPRVREVDSIHRLDAEVEFVKSKIDQNFDVRFPWVSSAQDKILEIQRG